MSLFLQKVTALDPAHDPARRRWLYIPYDQLTDALGPLSREQPDTLGIILIESLWKGKRRPYHKQKLAWILANQRQFALEQAARGVAVRYHFTHKAYAEILEQEVRDLAQCIRLMRPAERELRQNLERSICARPARSQTSTGRSSTGTRICSRTTFAWGSFTRTSSVAARSNARWTRRFSKW